MNNYNPRKVKVGSLFIGGDAPISVQTMTNTDARDFSKTIDQLKKIQKSGCDIVRLAVPDEQAASIFSFAKKEGITIPMVADIHFDYRLALAALKSGADKIRINPGNIGESWKVKEVAEACRSNGVPIRIGVNSGSLDKKLLDKYGSPTAEALAESAIMEAEQLERFGFNDIVISIKSSTVSTMIEACRKLSSMVNYPLHLGVTEAGDTYAGIIKNAIGIGSLLHDGIGSTIRVSLTADPLEEVRAGREILSSLNLNSKGGIQLISCPTCGRTRVPLIQMVNDFRNMMSEFDTSAKTLKVAIMGCVVNGPGEAREADIGIAGGDGFCVLFKHGEPCGRIELDNCLTVLRNEILTLLKD